MRLLNVLSVLLTVTDGVRAPAQEQQEIHPSKVYSVCQVLARIKALDGQTIAVRGVLVTGGHGSFLSSTCPSHLTTKGFTWPDVIWLTDPKNSEGRRVEADTNAHERVRYTISQFHLREGDQVMVTYVGMLEAKDLAQSVGANRAGQIVALGFGPGGDAPAQLVVETVKDPSVMHKKK